VARKLFIESIWHKLVESRLGSGWSCSFSSPCRSNWRSVANQWPGGEFL